MTALASPGGMGLGQLRSCERRPTLRPAFSELQQQSWQWEEVEKRENRASFGQELHPAESGEQPAWDSGWREQASPGLEFDPRIGLRRKGMRKAWRGGVRG